MAVSPSLGDGPARGLTWYLWLWMRGRDSTIIFQANISWYSLYLHSSMGGFR